ncbi:DUF1194 domain-containing protein [Hyphomicrobium sp.]|uniref:DUF1194 domain-containing protein n=1 Tax=Hyphomicrobium sp. TaxID=82 RepID=UPI0025B98FBE|nr:DUF1194 domain-containing protein [Hyphomicrobium sp.]MCC7252424.1 DUF1194 domain-containing protein [Hyphomicrobium sp.]
MVLLPAESRAQTLVDVEIVIAADVSVSMDREETRLQQEGFVHAFRHPDILSAIQSGPVGRIAVAYIEWGGAGRHRVVVPWSLIEDAESAHRFARRLEKNRPARFNRGTSISSALLRSYDLLLASGYSATRRVINISGDGVQNKGPDLALVRSELLSAGVTINGLPIVYKGLLDGVVAGPERETDPRVLIEYFEQAVIGGPYAFVEPVTAIESYTEAVRRKLIREIRTPMYAGLRNAGWTSSAEDEDRAAE